MTKSEGKLRSWTNSIRGFAVEVVLGAFIAWGVFAGLGRLLGPLEGQTLRQLQYATFLGLGAFLLFRPAHSAVRFFRELYDGATWTRAEFTRATGQFLSEILIVAAFVIVTGFYISADAELNQLTIWPDLGRILVQIGIAMLAGTVTGVVLAFVSKSLTH